MAKKSLKKRIDDLVDALGGAEKPTLAQIRSDLVSLGTLAQELEDGHALAEKETAIAALEAELGNLKIELQSANAEIETILAEQKERQEKEREMSDIQFEILKRLPIEEGGQWLRLNEISYAVKIPADEAAIHLKRLQSAGLISGAYDSYGAAAWNRTTNGSEFVLARRLASEKTVDPKNYRYGDLPRVEQVALILIARSEEGISEMEITLRLGSMLASTLLNLAMLTARGFAADANRGGHLRGEGRTLALTKSGAEYLTERDLL